MCGHGKLPCMALLTALLVLAALPPAARADRSMVIMSEDCPYLLLDSSDGQMLIKLITGNAPQVGDQLEGNFPPKAFSDVTNRRTDESLNVWVDMIDRHGNRALSRYVRYCS